uniref:Putative secreted protein n=1 Tax=Anopheles darlingi TaxID=43151 RepID=A0A2M4DG31_ANODA
MGSAAPPAHSMLLRLLLLALCSITDASVAQEFRCSLYLVCINFTLRSVHISLPNVITFAIIKQQQSRHSQLVWLHKSAQK